MVHLFSIFALILIAVAAALALYRQPASDAKFWTPAFLMVIGPAVWFVGSTMHGWDSGLEAALWTSVFATALCYLVISWREASARSLLVLQAPYLLVMAGLAALIGWGDASSAVELPGTLVLFHILVSLGTYAMATIAAVAGFAVVLKERALKAKGEPGFAANLSSVYEAEKLLFRCLTLSAIVLGAGIVTGMASGVILYDQLLKFDHKTVLSIAALAAICLALFAHAKMGLRGRRASRFVLIVYLLLTLAYPGVKAVRALIGA